MLLVASAELFNKTVEENEDDFKRWFKVVFGPVESASAWLHRVAGGEGSLLGKVVAPLVLLGLGGLIYVISEPDFGFNDRSLVVLLSMLTALAILTYFYNGGQIFMAHRLGVGMALQLFPVGILFALISIGLTRLDDFQPLVIYGFVASAAAVGGVEHTREQEGQVFFYPTLALLGLCLGAWLLLSPARSLATGHDGLVAALPEAVAAGVLVGGLEGLFFQMIPLRYMDGHKIWSWNKAAWLLVAGLSAFAAWQLLFNHERSSIEAIGHGTPEAAIAAMVVCFGLSFGLWAFFRLREGALPAEA